VIICARGVLIRGQNLLFVQAPDRSAGRLRAWWEVAHPPDSRILPVASARLCLREWDGSGLRAATLRRRRATRRRATLRLWGLDRSLYARAGRAHRFGGPGPLISGPVGRGALIPPALGFQKKTILRFVFLFFARLATGLRGDPQKRFVFF